MNPAQPVHPAPITPVQARAKCRKGLNALTDREVWRYSDKQILDDARLAWKAPVYKHYEPALERHYDSEGEPNKLVVSFRCKYKHPNHDPVPRDRMRTGDGTQTLIYFAKICDRRLGVTTMTPTASENPYTPAKHRAILAMRCARDRRSFASVVDELHYEEVKLLRPGTSLPSAATVSNDVRHIYQDASLGAAKYLQDIPGPIHLAVDGWTCLTSESFLGVIAFWNEHGRIWRVILEFIQLTKSHTGEYMAERIHDCLARYGITDKVGTICLDNAASNNTLVTKLQARLPNFRGPEVRVRCFAHITNLIARAFMSLFSPIPPPRRSSNTPAGAQVASDADQDMENEESTAEVDPDKLAHDQKVVEGLAAQALRTMRSSGMPVSEEELEMACGIMPKVAGLARRVNDSPTIDSEFRARVDSDPNLAGSARCLDRRCPTRWNSDRAALNSHLYFKGLVQHITGSRRALKKYALDLKQWDLAAELNEVLETFQEPTDRFSQSEVPLIHEVLPELLTLRARLYDVRDDLLNQGLHHVTRVAAEAALLVFDKYMGVMEESDIYSISVVMCPERKLKWFADRGFDVESIRRRVISRFRETFAPQADEAIGSAMSEPRPGGSIWTQRHSSFACPPPQLNRDTIEAYLDSSVVSEDLIAQYGGILPYWEAQRQQRPSVARMALYYLTAPASSVDAERAFSGGRLMINHLQHRTSVRSFQAQMAIGSWYNTPLLPNLKDVARMIENHM